MELKHFIKVPDDLVNRATGSCRTYLETFYGHCSGEKVLSLLKKQIEKDELYPEAQKKVPYIEAHSGPFRYVKSGGFFATVEFENVLFYDKNKGVIIFENKADHYFFVVQSPQAITALGHGLLIQRGTNTRWGVASANDRSLLDWEDSLLGCPQLRRRNGLRQDVNDALRDMRIFGEDRRVLGCLCEERLKSLKKEEEVESEEGKQRRLQQVVLELTKEVYDCRGPPVKRKRKCGKEEMAQ